jgi:hypothetical protein
MKKRAFAILLTAALVAVQPISAFAASSVSTGGSSVTTTNPTVTADGQSLSTNGAGSKAADVAAVFAQGAAETAGLPEQVVASIASINSGANLASSVGKAELEGYAALTKTAAVVLNDKTTNAVANKEVPVTLYIPNLLEGLQNVKILYYENATGQWKVVEPTAIDFANKTITFNMFGSGTVTIIHK